jgi:hypothetical protein
MQAGRGCVQLPPMKKIVVGLFGELRYMQHPPSGCQCSRTMEGAMKESEAPSKSGWQQPQPQLRRRMDRCLRHGNYGAGKAGKSKICSNCLSKLLTDARSRRRSRQGTAGALDLCRRRRQDGLLLVFKKPI